MRQLPVNLPDLEMAMTFDSHDLIEAQTSYLDLHTGEVIDVWESDDEFADIMSADPEENRQHREAVERQTDRFIAVPQLDPVDDNDMLLAFLDSHWTDDDALRRSASEAYHGSIGRWKKAIDHDPIILRAWHEFEQQAVHRRVLAFLAEHGIEPVLDPQG